MDLSLLRVIGALLMSLASSEAYCAEDNFMVHYACVDAKFREQIPVPIVIDAKEELTISAVREIAQRIPKNLQFALIGAANLSITAGRTDSQGRVVPEKFYKNFVSHVGIELKGQFDIEACGPGLEDALYDVGINRYFSYMLGRGEIYHWFVENGGPYSYPAWIAAVVALELTGRSPDLMSWKRFYKRYAVKFKRSERHGK